MKITLPAVFSTKNLPSMPKLSLFSGKTQAPASSKASSTDTLDTQSSAQSSKPVLKTSAAPETPVQASGSKTVSGHVLSALNVARKGLTAIVISPLVGAWAVVALAAVVTVPVVGSVMAGISGLRDGSGKGASLIFAGMGFQSALDDASTTSVSMLKKLTDACRITK